jgi:inner membrane protein
MDNLSHSVVGLAAGEFIHRILPEEPDVKRCHLRQRLLLSSCWLASNFPDLDLVLTPLLPAPLGYLLHHRGHTHTLLCALPQALLIWAMIWLLWPSARALLKQSRTTRWGLMLTLSVGLGLHMLMDYLNSYGIHPFHPYDSRWFFGDMVFILEPVFWVACGIPVAMAVKSRWLKGLLVACLIGLLVFFAMRGFLLWGSLFFLIGLALVLGLVQQKSGARGIAALGLSAFVMLAFIGVQNFSSQRALLTVVQSVESKDPKSRFLDASMTAFPSNPFCWTFASIESNERAGTYRLRRGVLSVAPEAMPVAECPAAFSERPRQKEATPSIVFLDVEEGSLRTLRDLQITNCHVGAWLRFARMPLVSKTQASDERFASGLRENFTTMRFGDFDSRECSPHIPGWDFPRKDLLTPPSRK